MTVCLVALGVAGLGALAGCSRAIQRLRQTMQNPVTPDAEKVVAQNQWVRLHRQAARLRTALCLLGIGFMAWGAWVCPPP